MTAEEFLIQQWNKCIWMVHEDYPGNIVMVYDKHHERKMKLNSLNDSKDEINFIKTNESRVLFYQDYKNGYLDVNYNKISSVLLSKYNINYNEIKVLIKNTLLEDNKLKQLITTIHKNSTLGILLEDNKLKNI
ncbi:hypothetical protein M0Q50_02435 [bacterium]|jgi:hypothetical protein|nr:hypothetical protein [bacterium]